MTAGQLMLCYLLPFFMIYAYTSGIDECKLVDIEESVHVIDIMIDRLKFKREDDIPKATGNIYGTLSALIDQYHALPGNCQKSSKVTIEFLRDIKLLHECTNSLTHDDDAINFLSGFSSKDTSYFRDKLICADNTSPNTKKVDMYRALARVSFLGDAEINQEFFNKAKELIGDADSAMTKILTEIMVLIAAKTIRITDSYKFHPELLQDLHKLDKSAGQKSAEMIGHDLSSKFGAESLEIIYHIPDLSLRCYAYLAICSKASKHPKKEDILVYLVPHLLDVMQSSEFEYLDRDLKEELLKAFEDLPEKGRALVLGEMCIYYISDNSTKENNVYVKRNSNGTMLDWIFTDTSEGNVNRKLISADPHAMQIFLPVNSTASEFWTGGDAIAGKWEMVLNGFDCSFRIDTHNLYICYNIGKLMLSPERVEIFLNEDRQQIEEYNFRRKENCGQ